MVPDRVKLNSLTNLRRNGNHTCNIVITRNLRAVLNMTLNASASSFGVFLSSGGLEEGQVLVCVSVRELNV